MSHYVICRTNLDLFNEQWPNFLPSIPRVGDLIESKTVHKGFILKLQVVRVTWRYNFSKDEYYAELELHMTDYHKMLFCKTHPGEQGSIKAFYEWYAPLVGKEVGYFI